MIMYKALSATLGHGCRLCGDVSCQVDRQECAMLTLHEQMEALEREHAVEIEQVLSPTLKTFP